MVYYMYHREKEFCIMSLQDLRNLTVEEFSNRVNTDAFHTLKEVYEIDLIRWSEILAGNDKHINDIAKELYLEYENVFGKKDIKEYILGKKITLKDDIALRAFDINK